MKKYNKPELKITEFMAENIITASGAGEALTSWNQKEENKDAVIAVLDFNNIKTVF